MRDNKKLVEAIGAMRPALDNRSPPTFAHLSSNQKGKRMAAGKIPYRITSACCECRQVLIARVGTTERERAIRLNDWALAAKLDSIARQHVDKPSQIHTFM